MRPFIDVRGFLVNALERHFQSHWLHAVLFLTGLILTGSDGEWFPVPNIIGISLVGLFSLLRWERLNHKPNEKNSSQVLKEREELEPKF